MSLHGELRAVLFGEETELVVIDYLKGDHGLLAIEKTCQRCDTEMRFSVKAGLSDKFVWRCKRKGCKTSKGLEGAILACYCATFVPVKRD